MIQLSIRLAATLMKWAVRAVAALFVLLALAWAALHWVIVPRIDEWRPRLEQLASEAIAAPVRIGAIRAESNALVPAVALLDVQVHDPSGRAGLRVPRVLAAFSVLSLARGELEQLVIDQPELEVRRTAQGRLLVAGIDLSGDAAGDTGAADWFFSQPEFVVRGGRVSWTDEQRAAPPVGLHDVQLVVRNGRWRHQMRLDATPGDGWGERFTLIGRFRQPVLSLHAGQWRDWDGQLYADLPHVDVSLLRRHADLKAEWGVDLREGRGALRAWADVRRGALAGVTSDLALGAVSVRFGPGLEPLAFGSVSGRLGWRHQAGAVDIDTHGLRFVDADGVAWPGGNFALNYRDGQGGQAAGGELRGDTLDLAALAKIARRLPLPPAVHERLAAHPVQGRVDSITARWDGPLDAPRDWRLQARLSALSVGARPAPPRADGTPVAGVPGIEGASLELEASGAGGKATLGIREGALEFPGVFEEPRIPLAELSVQAQWRVQGERIEVDVDELKLRNADATASFKARWHTAAGERRYPGVLDLEGAFSRADGARVHRYLPLGIPAPARHYVRDAIQKGEARDFAVKVKGNLLDVPFDRNPAAGEFRFAGQVQGVTMAYVPRALQPEEQTPWPALEGLAGELIFERNGMQVRNASARVQGHPGWRFARIQAGIADMGHARVLVDADGQGPLAAALGIVRQSPAAQYTQHALDEASASGDAALKLRLDLPVDRIENARVEGRATLQGNDLRITPASPPLGRAQGVIGFSETGFTLQDARAHLLGGEARISGGTVAGAAAGAPSVVLRASGTATAEGLRAMHDWAPLPAFARQASGSAAYEASMAFRAGAPEVAVASDLRGLALDLPAPLGKSAEAAWPLRFQSGPQAGEAGRERLRLAVADQLALDYELDTGARPARVLRGAVGIGPQATAGLALPAAGV
ncbi:YhdP family protein, partial [Ottowia sp.]|uniref:YhdP family phospholipid transporter n=1 Tax=Ottowia sp. TaxID=1898956 RepID=UPI0039E4B033